MSDALIRRLRTAAHPGSVLGDPAAPDTARLLSALAEALAQLEEERARIAAVQAAPQVVGYLSRTGHGTYFRESLTPTVARLEFGGKPVWRPVAFVDNAPPLAIIPGDAS